MATIGRLEARFVLGSELGSGGFGIVYRAEELGTGRPAAVKLAHQAVDAGGRERILREAGLHQGLTHPNLVGFLGVLEAADGRLALAYELVEGEPLDFLLARGPLSPGFAAARITELAAGLDALHARGLVHRDVKAENVMIGPDGMARLLDFGLLRGAAAGQTVTETGVLLGTPEVMAPEQIAGARVGPAADVYALGCLAWKLLAGAPVFTGSTAELIEAHLRRDPPRLSAVRRGLPAALDPVLAGALAKSPAKRPASAGALARRLAEALAETRGAPDPPSRTILVGETVSGLHRALTPSPQRARTAPRAAHRPAWLLVAGGVLLAGVCWRPSGPGEPAPAPAPAAAEALPVPAAFDPAWFAAVRDDLARLKRTSPVGILDPLRWGDLCSRLPALARFHGWIAAGGHPEKLPDEVLAGLRRLDEGFAAEGYPRPFHPFAYLRPKEQGIPSPKELEDWPRSGELPPVPPGWHGVALEAMARFKELEAEREAGLKRDPVATLPAGLGELRHTIALTFFDERDLLAKVQQRVFATTDLRPALRPWMRPLAEAAAAGLYAAARALAEPETRLDAVWSDFYGLASGRMMPAFFWDHFSLPAEVCMGGVPETLSGWCLRFHLLDGQGFARHDVGDPHQEVAGLERLEFEAAERIFSDQAAGKFDDLRRHLVLRHLFFHPSVRRDQAGMVAVLRRYGAQVDECPSTTVRLWCGIYLGRLIAGLRPGEVLTREELLRIGRWLEFGDPAALPGNDGPLLRDLRARVAALVAALPPTPAPPAGP